MAEQRLIDVNPLVKGMKGRLKSYEKEYGYLSDFVSGYEEAIDDVVDTPTVEAKQVEWISVKDRLPEDEGYAFAWEPNLKRIIISRYNKKDKYWWNDEYFFVFPTHWMPLPEPPEEQ